MAKKKAEAHHGGAWKVAYADFVTAMMALFMVLWICAQDKKIMLATSKYFQSPFRSPLAANSGVMPYEKSKENTESSSSQTEDSGQNQPVNKDKQIELSFLNAVAADFYRLLHLDENLDQKPIDVQVTSDGLRITLFDRARRPLFNDRSAELTEWGKFLMQNLAWLIDRHRFRVTIDGHTRRGIDYTSTDYGAWELSADRANSARRTLVHYAVDSKLIERVTGYADTRPMTGEPAVSEANQRITLSLTLVAREKTSGHDQTGFHEGDQRGRAALNTAPPPPVNFQPPLSALP